MDSGDDDGPLADLNRRRLLGALGASTLAIGVAGCTGGDDGTGEPDGDGSGDANDDGAAKPSADDGVGECTPGHTEGDPPCEQIADDAEVLTGFDAAGTTLPVAFDHPCGWLTSTTDQYDDRAQANVTRDGIGEADAYVDVQVRAYYQAVGDGFLESRSEEGNYEEIDYEYDGETRTGLVSAASTAQYGTIGHAVVPFQESLVHVELVSTLHAESCAVEPRPDYGLVEAMLRSIGPNPETTFSPTSTDTQSQQASREAVENSVDGLEIVAHEGSVADENYSVTVTVENSGDRVTDIEEYDFRVRLFDADGTDITGAGGLVWGQEGDLAPGERIEFRVESTVEDGAEPADVASYQVRVECGSFSEGVYCQ